MYGHNFIIHFVTNTPKFWIHYYFISYDYCLIIKDWRQICLLNQREEKQKFCKPSNAHDQVLSLNCRRGEVPSSPLEYKTFK